METGGRFGRKILVMIALLTTGMDGGLDAEATDCALAITDWEEYCCVEKVDEWSGTVKCTLTGVERQEMKRGDLEEEWTVGAPFTIEGTMGEDDEDEEEYYLYLDLGLNDGTEPDEYTANVEFSAEYDGDTVCEASNEVEVVVLKVESVDGHPNDTDTHKIAAVANSAHDDHFVCVKNTGDIILNATIIPTNAIDNIIWEADDTIITSPGVGSDKSTASLSSSVTKRIIIRMELDEVTCWEGIVWVAWVSLTANYNVNTTELHDNNEWQLSDYEIWDIPHLGLAVESSGSIMTRDIWRRLNGVELYHQLQ